MDCAQGGRVALLRPADHFGGPTWRGVWRIPGGRLDWAVVVVVAFLAAVNVVDARIAHAALVLGRPAPWPCWRWAGGLG